jgi:hypothetical protein
MNFLNEELTISNDVKKTTELVCGEILKNPNKKIYTFVNSIFFIEKLVVNFSYENFETDLLYKRSNKRAFNGQATKADLSEDYDNKLYNGKNIFNYCVINVNSAFIQGKPVPYLFYGTIQHEIEHLYQMFEKQGGLYNDKKLSYNSDVIVSEEEAEQIYHINEIIYFSRGYERDAFVNGLYNELYYGLKEGKNIEMLLSQSEFMKYVDALKTAERYLNNVEKMKGINLKNIASHFGRSEWPSLKKIVIKRASDAYEKSLNKMKKVVKKAKKDAGLTENKKRPMKTIYLNESQIDILRKADVEETYKLPKFIYKAIKDDKTSLGDNEALPSEGEFDFKYGLLKNRFKTVTTQIREIVDLPSYDEESVLNYLGKVLKETRDIEKDIKNELEELCYNAVMNMLEVPENQINLQCELVDKIKPAHPLNITPDSKKNAFDFEDATQYDSVNKEILKRRMVDCIIQGAANRYLYKYEYFLPQLYRLNRRLPQLYETIIALDNYLLFIKKEEITEEKPMQGAYVEVLLGREGEKTDINAQGVLFPYLLQETLRGFFELFASHALPEDNKLAMYITKQADFLLAEPWDKRFGIQIWDEYFDIYIDKTSYLPYFLTDMFSVSVDEFNDSLKNVFLNTKKGNLFRENLRLAAEKSVGRREFKQRLDKKTTDNVLLTDGYFSGEELDSFLLDETDDVVLGGDNNIAEQLVNANFSDFGFVKSKETPIVPNYTDINLIVNDKLVPTSLVKLHLTVKKLNGERLYALHTFLADEVQNKGLYTKIKYAFVMKFGNTYDPVGMVMNKPVIDAVNKKISSLPNVEVQTLTNEFGKKLGVVIRRTT